MQQLLEMEQVQVAFATFSLTPRLPLAYSLPISLSLSVFIYVAASFCISNHVADSIVASATVALYAKLLHDNASGCQKSQARDQGRTEGGRGACRLA